MANKSAITIAGDAWAGVESGEAEVVVPVTSWPLLWLYRCASSPLALASWRCGGGAWR